MLDSPRIVSLSPMLVLYENKLQIQRGITSQRYAWLQRVLAEWRKATGQRRRSLAREFRAALLAWRMSCEREHERHVEMVQQAQMEETI